MGFRFWRRVKVAPGVTLNLSKSGGSLSVGPRGGKVTLGPRGGRATAGIPGTGLFYTTTLGGGKGGGARRRGGLREGPPAGEKLTMGFFKRLVTPNDEEALVDGCRSIVQGDEEAALRHLRKAAHLADGAYLAGYLALKGGKAGAAVKLLGVAVDNSPRLGRYLGKYGISAAGVLQITDEVSAVVEPGLRGALLLRVEALQRESRWREAIGCLERLRRLEPDDVVVKLSLAELLMDARPLGANICRRVVSLAQDIQNDSAIHAALLLYKARALRKLGLLDAAIAAMTMALRKQKDRPRELLLTLRYSRAFLYEAAGRVDRARGDLERLYAEAPEFEDVASHLRGLSK